MEENKEKDHCIFYYLNPFRKMAWWKSIILWLIIAAIIRIIMVVVMADDTSSHVPLP